MRTPWELLEYVDRIIDIGVDKMETHSQFALIDLQSASGKQDENCGKMLTPLVENADERGDKDGHGTQT
jgi:hypothetical protein